MGFTIIFFWVLTGTLAGLVAAAIAPEGKSGHAGPVLIGISGACLGGGIFVLALQQPGETSHYQGEYMRFVVNSINGTVLALFIFSRLRAASFQKPAG